MSTKEYRSNYDKLVAEWEKKILQLDFKALSQKLPDFQEEEEILRVTHFNRQYGLNKGNGIITCLDKDEKICNKTKLNIYTFLWYVQEYACLQHKWSAFRELRGASPFTRAFEQVILQTLAKNFSGKAEQFRQAAERLEGQAINYGDAGYLIYAFASIPMQFIFWDEDDDFPAQANILFDYSVTDFIHVESVVTLASEGVRRLLEEAKLNIDENIFSM